MFNEHSVKTDNYSLKTLPMQFQIVLFCSFNNADSIDTIGIKASLVHWTLHYNSKFNHSY